MRLVFYILGGIISALIGWNLSLLILDFFKFTLKAIAGSEIPFPSEWILFPIVATCLSLTLVLTTIYLSNPTHDKANRRKRGKYLKLSLQTGLIAGAIAALFSVVIYQGKFPPESIRIVGWSAIGLGTGLAEGLCWRSLSTEGRKSTTIERPIASALFGFLAGLFAAISIEFLRKTISLGGYEDALGFTLFGAALGIALALSTTPTYQVALRAGRGFGYRQPGQPSNEEKKSLPEIRNRSLNIVYFPDEKRIEEGLSIQLPRSSSESLIVGSDESADIFLPEIPARAATLTLEGKQWKLKCLFDGKIQVQRKLLSEDSSQVLYHNQILTFYHEKDKNRYYRFVFYDRFLDPET
ncbi:hypothetical protein V0288_04755 [Pannus brasiliensis CCIBt3594]|uniref:Uncharacterized protein n=1 Tax=Pannus brasiliensis CCIBt3594 TaxID=1427578 RepID=A0AAW9QNV4_9CHRO